MIVPATLEHAGLKVNLPGLDRVADPGIAQAIRESDEAWTWLVDGKPACIWGVKTFNLLAGTYMWLYPSELVVSRRYGFLRECLRLKADFLARYPVIYGFCNLGFEPSERWLKWLGARFEPPVDYQGLQLSKFWINA